jgi:shikimate kinase
MTSEPKIRPGAPARIYLTGFMGSGKSTLGAALAERIGYGFIDLDQVIVERIEMPIAAYFKQYGEARFRRLETSVLHETAGQAPVVVAVGGGALVTEANLAFARGNGLVVYLMVDPTEILRRLHAGKTTRPMLLGDDGKPLPDKQVSERIARLLAAREPFYHRAHLAVDVGQQTVESACRELQVRIEEYIPRPR